MLQGRHAFELGGVGWMLTHVLSHGALLASVCSLTFEAITWEVYQLRAIGGGAVGIWWLAFGVLLYNGEREYRGTFFSFQTAAQFAHHTFETGGTVTRSNFMDDHPELWLAFKPEIVEWLEDNWESWEVEKPAWFTKKWKESVPIDMRPGLVSEEAQEGEEA